jgi:glycosyltransferase involved in cell wall biosynthesis
MLGRYEGVVKKLTAGFDTLESPPRVAPVVDERYRVKWSVMIPTFNCAGYLRQTLESVLAQDPGPAAMEIEVVDDCSTADDPSAVVAQVGRGRVRFHKKPVNEGAIRNFNTCIERSSGEFVHILHGDDFVLPGFYSAMETRLSQCPNASMAFCRSLVVDERSEIEWLTSRMPALEEAGHYLPPVSNGNFVQTPSVVMRRVFYERSGGFLPSLVHTADWEMWLRALRFGGGLSVNLILAAYRSFGANDSNRLSRTGENLLDYLRLSRMVGDYFTAAEMDKFILNVAKRARVQAELFGRSGDWDAHRANSRIYSRLTPLRYRLAYQALKLVRR